MVVNPTKNIVSKKQQYQDHIQNKRFDTSHFGTNNCNFIIFHKRHSQGKITRRRLNLKRKTKVGRGNRVHEDRFNITGVKISTKNQTHQDY